MMFRRIAAGAAIAAGVMMGWGAVDAAAAPAPGQPGAPVLPPAGPDAGTPPAWAPPKPVDPVWANGQPQVWDEGWNHWGVWENGVFVPTY
ncbi:hypothetical protein [Mycolicibacterium madagascariense]|nr:hypothetical protein [Mycolicibacterium madagascariense]MCV7015271.1 hypothetical protein [Mycolicibacterium madagascariense]